MTPEEVINKCRNAVMVVGIMHPHFLLVHARIRNLYQVTSDKNVLSTMGITKSGRILLNSEFVEKLSPVQLAGVLFHEMLHLMLLHHDRVGVRDPWRWNIAADMCINKALSDAQINLPDTAVYPPREYSGELATESVYDWLGQNQKHLPKQPDVIMPGAGCSALDDEGAPMQGDGEGAPGAIDCNGNPVDWRMVAAEAVAAAKLAGTGSSSFVRLLEPRETKVQWQKIIRKGASMVMARPGRDFQTMSKRGRRSPQFGPQFAGWLGLSPRICVMADVSGSMNPEWVEQIITECKGMIKQFSGINIYFISHTSEVTWKGWITPSTTAKLTDAVNHSGGTDPWPAYKAAEEVGKFDAIVHFTDGHFFKPDWPEYKARSLIVGLYDINPSTKPPPGSVVIPCFVD